MFRHEYRVRERKLIDNYSEWTVEFKRWYFPFYWKEIGWFDYFTWKEVRELRLQPNCFSSIESAKAFALKFATIGYKAFILDGYIEKTFYLGRLP